VDQDSISANVVERALEAVPLHGYRLGTTVGGKEVGEYAFQRCGGQ
jgi:hypothetical protein